MLRSRTVGKVKTLKCAKMTKQSDMSLFLGAVSVDTAFDRIKYLLSNKFSAQHFILEFLAKFDC